MSEKESDFLKSLKKTLASTGVALIGILLTFYFGTKAKLAEHDKRINQVEQTTVSKTEYNARVTHIDYINVQVMNQLDKMDEKLDKLIESR